MKRQGLYHSLPSSLFTSISVSNLEYLALTVNTDFMQQLILGTSRFFFQKQAPLITPTGFDLRYLGAAQN
jgi:hypothetical protein